MSRIALALSLVVLLASCATPATPSSATAAAAVADLAPTGKVRAAINFGNPILATKDTASGAKYLTEFVATMKASGFVAQALARHGIEGAAVAPP
jgi:hypothetical protein